MNIPRQGTALRAAYDAKKAYFEQNRHEFPPGREFHPDPAELQVIIDAVRTYERERLNRRLARIVRSWIEREGDLHLATDASSTATLRTLARCRRQITSAMNAALGEDGT